MSYFACNVFLTCVEVNWQTEPRNKGKTEFTGCGREKVQGLLGVVNLLGKFGGGKLISWQLPKRSILEWSIRGVKENSSVIDRFSRTFEFSCGMRVLNRLSLSLHLPSAPPPQSDHVCTLPSLEFLTEQSCNSLAPCGSQPWRAIWSPRRGQFTYKLWSPPCVTAGLGTGCLDRETRRLSWSPHYQPNRGNCTREPAFYFFSVNTSGIDSLNLLVSPFYFERLEAVWVI